MPNRLAASTSPYLLQHQDNPVEWFEWGDEAFDEARRRDVPILLSVGYSACHWCHVMAHESFEDPVTAGEMNQGFVCVKVDREERPDVDSIYMEAVQAISGRGGWPMTVFLTPEGAPFHAGTYYPATDRHGMPAFRRVLAAISEAWADRREDLIEQSARLTEAIASTIPAGETLPGSEVLEAAYRDLLGRFDAVNGGFGGSPKFPQQPLLEFLLRIRSEPWADRADEMLEVTLSEMAAGGIHDHLGGGFARYSVDDRWLVPHFEKMLYDNAQLARIYLWTGIERGIEGFIEVSRSTLDYLLTGLRHPDGGFYTAEDADSEGVEGRFYVFTLEEFEEILGDDAADAARFFGVGRPGNFEGANVLHRPTGDPWTEMIEGYRQSLLAARGRRVRPGLDDKVVTAWNGLAIRALAEAGAALHEDRYLSAAEATTEFIMSNLVRDGLLMRSWRRGAVSVPGFLDDHASLAVGLFSLYAATGRTRWYQEAERLVGELDRFAHPDGGFFSTSAAGTQLPKRPVDYTDNPHPSGSGLAIEALLLASLYTGDDRFRQRAEDALRSVALLAERAPSMVGHHLSVLHDIHRGTIELAILGDQSSPLTEVYWRRFRPHVALARSAVESDTPPLLAGRPAEPGGVAYVCRGFVCNLPTSEPDLLAGQLT